MQTLHEYCPCHDALTLSEGVSAFWGEVVELVEAPSFDELSDVIYTINRFAGAVVRRRYVRLLPGDRLHLHKIALRMRDYGCIRSTRHLIDGRCPTAGRRNVHVPAT